MSPTLTLMLMRHAKAGPQSQDDHARRLTDGGRADAQAAGAFLADHDLVPQWAYVSSAARTRETFAIVQSQMSRATHVRLEDGLYNASAGQLRDMMLSFDAHSVMIVGHNPGIMDAAIAMARDGDANELRRMQGRFPPCALAVITFDQPDWAAARSSGGRLDLYLMPEDLGGGQR